MLLSPCILWEFKLRMAVLVTSLLARGYVKRSCNKFMLLCQGMSVTEVIMEITDISEYGKESAESVLLMLL